MLFRQFPLLAGLIGLVVLLSPEQAAAVGPPGILKGLGPFFWLSLGVSFLIACYLVPLIIVLFSTLRGGGQPSSFLDKETEELIAKCDEIIAKCNESIAKSETILTPAARRTRSPIPMPAFARNIPSDKTERNAEWPPESESAKRLTEEIRSKLPELRKAAEARRKKQPLQKSMDRAPASPRENTARDRPRRSFARPDKR